MPKLEVLENKKLVLKNVLRKELKNIQPESLSDEVSKLGILIEKLSVQAFGPLIVKSSGGYLGDDGVITIDYDLLVQAHNYKEFKSSFEPIERLEIPFCAYIHFEGHSEDIQFAHSKLDLHFYENDLEATGEIYSVMVEDSEHNTVVDIFKPVRRL